MKECAKKTSIVLENRVPTLFHNKIMNDIPEVDIIILGEPEHTIVDLVGRLIKKCSLKDCKGIVYRKDESLILHTEARPLEENLDQLGIPFRYRVGHGLQTYSIKGSRGCSGNCTFCDLGYMRLQPGNRVRFRSIPHIIDEMEMLKKNYNVHHFHFFDDSFCGEENAENRLQEFYEEMLNRQLNVRFLFNLRAELITKSVVKQLKKLETVGLDHLFIGMESGNEEDLRLFNKKASVEDNERSIKLLQKNNISFDFGFIMFNPYSDFKRLRKNINFIKNNDLFVNFDVLRRRLLLLPGTSILKKLSNDNLLLTDINEPAIGKTAYRFMDDRVKNVFDATFKIYERYPLKAEEHYVRLFSFYNNVKAVLGEEDYNTIALKNAIAAFKETSRRESIFLFTAILDYAEQGYFDLLEKTESMISYYIENISQKYEEVQKIRMPLAVKLQRKELLYTREI